MREQATETRSLIIEKARQLLALHGADGLGMRQIADSCGISVSVLYHYFSDKDDLLKIVFDETNTTLGVERARLTVHESAAKRLQQLVEFQINHAEEVVAVLKYYLAYRNNYHKGSQGVLPTKAYLHMVEVVQQGVDTGEFVVDDLVSDAQVMTHAVNGYLLEYYPESLRKGEQQILVKKITSFLLRALKGGEVHEHR